MPTITDKDILTFDENSKISLYFMSINIDKEIRELSGFSIKMPVEILIGGFLYKYYNLAKYRKIKIVELLANGWTENGIRLCNIFNMEKVGNDKNNHPIYFTKFDESKITKIKNIFPILDKLNAEYKNIK